MIIGIVIPYSNKNFYINRNYISWVENSKNQPVLILPNTPDYILNNLDGLIIPGGVDIDPTLFNEKNTFSKNCNPDLDHYQIKYIEYGINRNIPIFGVCRGHQLIFRYIKSKYPNDLLLKNIIYHQDIKNHNESKYETLSHDVINLNTTERFKVNSLHHQGISISSKYAHLLSDIVKIDYLTDLSLLNEKTLLIEGLSYNINNTIIQTVQWHPEALNHVDLLQKFFHH